MGAAAKRHAPLSLASRERGSGEGLVGTGF
jgi:hypothetical protein